MGDIMMFCQTVTRCHDPRKGLFHVCVDLDPLNGPFAIFFFIRLPLITEGRQQTSL
jgi:hypothetical protein